jgi:hypothetical protein
MKKSRTIYLILLVLLSLTSFEIFSVVEMNRFWQLYGLVFCLQGGFALIYLLFSQKNHLFDDYSLK